VTETTDTQPCAAGRIERRDQLEVPAVGLRQLDY
jgi:hypothetical protein